MDRDRHRRSAGGRSRNCWIRRAAAASGRSHAGPAADFHDGIPAPPLLFARRQPDRVFLAGRGRRARASLHHYTGWRPHPPHHQRGGAGPEPRMVAGWPVHRVRPRQPRRDDRVPPGRASPEDRRKRLGIRLVDAGRAVRGDLGAKGRKIRWGGGLPFDRTGADAHRAGRESRQLLSAHDLSGREVPGIRAAAQRSRQCVAVCQTNFRRRGMAAHA
jgi:hypothetical protein